MADGWDVESEDASKYLEAALEGYDLTFDKNMDMTRKSSHLTFVSGSCQHFRLIQPSRSCFIVPSMNLSSVILFKPRSPMHSRSVLFFLFFVLRINSFSQADVVFVSFFIFIVFEFALYSLFLSFVLVCLTFIGSYRQFDR